MTKTHTMMPSLSGKNSFLGNCCTVTGVKAVRMMEPIFSATSNEIAKEGGMERSRQYLCKTFLKGVVAYFFVGARRFGIFLFFCSPKERKRKMM